MQAHQKKAPTCVAIVGPTASGKTAAAIKIAEAINGEIICADSRTIYRDLDIGTAKPSIYEREQVPHWGLDLVSPGERYSAADFQKYAYQKIIEIQNRGSVPILVGGTGLYIDSVVLEYVFPDRLSAVDMYKYESMSLDNLHKYCNKNNIKLPENKKNKRHVIHAIATKDSYSTRKMQPKDDTLVVGISTDRKEIRDRIQVRAQNIFDNNVVEEAIKASKKYNCRIDELPGNIYKYIYDFLEGDITRSKAIELFAYSDIHLAKRQMTWFKRHNFIRWSPRNDIVENSVQYFVNEQNMIS